jgi:N-acetylglucosaminyl-diphospho-decaprenol L-rhamnosyltransferase
VPERATSIAMPITDIKVTRPVTISIVSHGHMALIRELLGQLNACSHTVIAKVVLTINIPEPYRLLDNDLRFPIEYIENAVAKGFGANHNQAFKRCSTPWFLVLNPDIRFTEDVLAALIATVHPQSGILTPRIYEPGKTAPEQHRAAVTPLEILMRRRPAYQPPLRPAWVPGLFMLFRANTFAQIGGFDERFFMYGEDFDICARAQLAGWHLQVEENLAVVHDARRASHGSARHFFWHVSSLLKVWTSPTFWRFQSMRNATARGGH